MTATITTEQWNLYLDMTYQAPRWPWPGTAWMNLSSEQVALLPHAIDDFTRYSPSDGPTDMAQVPVELPRETPRAITRFAAYHDDEFLYVFIDAIRPDQPIPELVDVVQEDFSCVIPLSGVARGLYFGLNQNNESIGCVQIWDADLQPEDAALDWPFSLLTSNPGMGPSASTGGILQEGYSTRCIATDTGLVGCFRIEKRLLASVLADQQFHLSVGRRSGATAELLSWGSPIVWCPRPDQHGTVRLVDAVQGSIHPALYRVDVLYDPSSELGEIIAQWRNITPETITHLSRGLYADFATKTTLALNGLEVTADLAPLTRATFAIPDGWNRLEVLTAMAPPRVASFQKFTGRHVVGTRSDARALPDLDVLKDAFYVWHQTHDKTYLGHGTWGQADAPAHCLCHDGIFNALPYIVAYRYLESAPVYETRIRETCARMLEHQQPAGWFPCGCVSNDPNTIPPLGEGGAFTNGSVGEGLMLAGALLGEDAWLTASIRAADYSWYRWEYNQNYMAFALWHLAALRLCAPRDEWIAKASYFAQFVSRDIGLCGAQNEHNYFTGYGNITLKGLARLLYVLPREHRYYGQLKEKVIRYTNQMLSRQQPSGFFAGRNRKYLGYHHVVPGLCYVAEAIPEVLPDLMPALSSMTWPIIETCKTGQAQGLGADEGLLLALMAQLAVSKQ